MAFDVTEPGTDEWWLVRLATQLGESFPRLENLRKYRDGEAMLPESALGAEAREAWVQFARMNRMHVVELLRDARTSKQRVVGFRTASPGDENGDEEAWGIWRGSQMAAYQRDFFNDVADYGSAFLISEAPDVPGERSTIRPVSPWTVATEPRARRPWESEVAIEVGYDALQQIDMIKFWRRDPETGQVYARIAFREVGDQSQIPSDGQAWSPGTDWDWLSIEGAGDTIVLPMTRVPVVKATTDTGLGVWEKHLDTVDRVNFLTFQTMQIVVTQAFRQAAVSGDLPDVWPDDPAVAVELRGQPIDYSSIYRMGPAALWRLPAGGQLQEFTPVDPRPIREQRDDEIRKLAAFTSTPFYMLSSDSANNSAEGASLASDTLYSKVETLNDRSQVALEQALACAFEAMGDQTRADIAGLETMWGPFKRASLSEMGSAAQQAKAGGASQRWIDEHIFAMTPAERDQAEVDRMNDSLFSGGSSESGSSSVDSVLELDAVGGDALGV